MNEVQLFFFPAELAGGSMHDGVSSTTSTVNIISPVLNSHKITAAKL